MTSAQRPGAIALIAIIIISAFALAVMTTASFTATRGLTGISTTSAGERTFAAAEAGLQDALYRLGSDSGTGSYTTTVNGLPATINITAASFQRTITSSVTDPALNVTRAVRISVNVSSFGGSVLGAVQGGTGGLQIDNGGQVYGDVYIGDASGGSITSQNNAFLHGNVSISSPSGIADNITLPTEAGGTTYDLHVHTIKNSTISGDAFYNTLSGSNTVHGSSCPNSHCHAGSSDPAPRAYFMTNNDIQNLATQIQNSGTIISTCDGSGNYTISPAQPLPNGPAKINCNLVFNGNNVSGAMELQGNLWVTGDVTFNGNNQTLQLPTSANGHSAFIIMGDPFASPTTAKGKLLVTNNVSILGSEHPSPANPKDYIFFISMSNLLTSGSPAITGSNNSSAAVYFAPNGMIEVSNGANLNNTTAKKIHINNASITFTSNLGNFFFGPTTQSPPTPDPATWQEL